MSSQLWICELILSSLSSVQSFSSQSSVHCLPNGYFYEFPDTLHVIIPVLVHKYIKKCVKQTSLCMKNVKHHDPSLDTNVRLLIAESIQ